MIYAELAPDILLHHFDELVNACTDLLKKSLPVLAAWKLEY